MYCQVREIYVCTKYRNVTKMHDFFSFLTLDIIKKNNLSLLKLADEVVRNEKLNCSCDLC